MDTEIGCFRLSEAHNVRKETQPQFKLEAVRIVSERGVTIARASRDLDVHANVLRKWVREFAADPGMPFPVAARGSRSRSRSIA